MATTATDTADRDAWIYCRISEAIDDLGVKRQERELRDYCATRRWRVAGVFSDNDLTAYSGKKRAGYDRLLSVIRKGDVIVTTEMTRLTRGDLRAVEDLIELVEASGASVSATRAGDIDLSTSGGRMVARLLCVVARNESEVKSERVRSKQVESANNGIPAGRKTYGYDIPAKGTIAVNDEEKQIVLFMRDWVLAGRSLNSLVSDLNERGIAGPAGGRWNLNGVKRLLTNPKLAGLRTHKGEIVGPGKWEPIVTREDHERMKAVLSRLEQGAKPRVSVYTGVLRCAHCGALMQRQAHKLVRGSAHDYQCKRNRGCGGVSIKGQPVDDFITDRLLGYALTIDLSAARAQLAGVSGAQLVSELADDERLLVELADDLAAKRITRAEWIAIRQPVADRIDATKRELAAMNRPAPDAATFDSLTPTKWKGLELEQKRAVVDMFIEQVDIAKGQPGVRDFSDEALERRIKIGWKV